MKLIRCGDPGDERPGVQLDDGTRLDLSSEFGDYDSAFFDSGEAERLAALLEGQRAWPQFPPEVRTGSPVARPHKLLAVGLNYRTHAQELGSDIPEEPEIFTKQSSSICGPDDDFLIPPGCQRLDYENELAFVVKESAHYLADESAAAARIGGYLVCNDGTARDFTARGSQWTKGKSCDTFGPLGPWLVTPDELGDPQRLDIETRVNGAIRQNGNTGDMIFGCAYILWYLSQFMRMEPGDVVTTGTPIGVAAGMDDPGALLKKGDVLELRIQGLGTQKHHVRPA